MRTAEDGASGSSSSTVSRGRSGVAETGRDEALDRRVVVRAEDELRLVTGAAQGRIDLDVQVRVVNPDERQPAAWRRVTVLAGDLRGGGRREEHEGVVEHPAYGERAVGHGQRGEGQVEAAGLDALRQFAVLEDLLRRSSMPGTPAGTAPADRAAPGCRRSAATARAACRARRRGWRRCRPGRRSAAPRRRGHARPATRRSASAGPGAGRRGGRAAAIRPPLEAGDLLADGRLGVAQLQRGRAERARVGDGEQGHELAGVPGRRDRGGLSAS